MRKYRKQKKHHLTKTEQLFIRNHLVLGIFYYSTIARQLWGTSNRTYIQRIARYAKQVDLQSRALRSGRSARSRILLNSLRQDMAFADKFIQTAERSAQRRKMRLLRTA